MRDLRPGLKRFWPLVVGGGLFFIQGFGAARHDSPTYDEPLHLTSGYVYLKTGLYWIDASAPPLARIVTALPLLLLPLEFSRDDPAWMNGRRFAFCAHFLSHNTVSQDTLFLLARTMVLLLGLLLSWMIWAWAEEAWGETAAAMSLLYFAACPPLLAHGHLVTTDFAYTTAFVGVLWGFWRFLRRPEERASALLAGIALGAALNIKYSAISIFGILGCLFLMERPWKTGSRTVLLQGLKTIAWTTLLLCLPFYGFKWRAALAGISGVGYYSVHGWAGYLLGHFSEKGWPWYFVLVLLLKTPLVLLVMAWGSLWLVRGVSERRFLSVWILSPAWMILAITSLSRIQVGVRHLLPIYPLLCMAAGAATAALWQKHAIGRSCAIAAILGSLFVSVAAYPYYIAYFGELAGGSSNGYKILADSNCDWGQELKALSVYLKKTTPGPIYLSYFGNIDPADYGIAYEALHPAVDAPMTRDRMVEAGQPGTVLLAVSATNRQGLYYKRHDTFQWLDSLRPVSVLGHTLFVYDITRDARAHREMSRLYAEAGLTDRVNNELDWVKRLEAGS